MSIFYRARLFTISAIVTVASGGVLYSSLSHASRGLEADATVLRSSSECKVEFQFKTADHSTTLPMECDAATAFQARVGANKVKLYRQDFLNLRYALKDGETHEAKIAAALVNGHGAAIGSRLPVVYDPEHPDDARAPLTGQVLAGTSGVFAVSLLLTLFSIGLNPIRLVRPLASRVPGADVPEETDTGASADAAVARMYAMSAKMARTESPVAPAPAAPSFSQAGPPTFGKRRVSGMR